MILAFLPSNFNYYALLRLCVSSLPPIRKALNSYTAMSYAERQRASSAVGAKTARACDGCLRRRARWFCEADDAFLCQVCDASVHSANPLARRHRRVRLKTASSLSPMSDASDDHETPAWFHGLKRKPRTPRGKPVLAAAPKAEPVVPDLEALSAEENYPPGEEEQLLYCVPILDPVLTEFCSSHSQPPLDVDAKASAVEVKPAAAQESEYTHVAAVPTADGLAGLHHTDLDLAEFASDMETLLGRGLDDDSFCIDGLGLMDAAAEDDGEGQVKLEMDLDVGTSSGDAAACDFRMEIGLSRETLDLGFDSPTMAVEGEEHIPLQEAEKRRPMILRLDYEAVIATWSSNGCSPWMDGERPLFDPNDSWPDFPEMAGRGGGVQGMYQQVAHMMAVGEGREARVSRYREKRRTRLFSKKIRYEVRKLNAEKRPRMKGRFVKRPVVAAAFPEAGTASTFAYR